MQRKLVLALMIATPILGCATSVSAQTAKSVAGTYSGVSFVTTDASGMSTPTFGDNPRAMMILTPQGRYSIVVMREDLPKFAANRRVKGTPEEYKAVVEGSIAHFGRYTIDDKGKTIT